MENPYAGLLNLMQEQGKKYNPPTISIGTVISTSPLTIKTGDLILEQEDLLVNYELTSSYERTCNVTINGTLSSSTASASGGSGEASFASHSHSINAQATLTGDMKMSGETTLKVNDLVVLLPTENRQIYVVFVKVVNL